MEASRLIVLIVVHCSMLAGMANPIPLLPPEVENIRVFTIGRNDINGILPIEYNYYNPFGSEKRRYQDRKQ